MNLTFKQFLNEAAVSPLKITPVEEQDLLEAVEKYCSQALAQFRSGKALWKGWQRGSIDIGTPSLIDPSTSSRVSENTSNFYTALLDSNPANAEFPKRSKSLICSTSKTTAEGYGMATALLPFDGTDIGMSPHPDLWNSGVKVGGRTYLIHDLNELIEMLFGKMDPAPTFAEFGDMIRGVSSDAMNDKIRAEVHYITNHNLSPEELEKFKHDWAEFYDYSKMGFEVIKPGDIPSGDQECWFSAPCFAIPSNLTYLLMRS